MAGSAMTFTYRDGPDASGRAAKVRKVICNWTSDDSAGTASGTTELISGELLKIVTDPGSAAPTDSYVIAITDEEGADVLAGIQNSAALADRDTTNTEQTYLHLLNADGTPVGFATYPIVCDKLTIAVSAAGNSKTGQIILYYR